MTKIRILAILAAAAIVSLTAGAAHADSFNVGGTGACAGGTTAGSLGTMGNPVDALATITVSTGTITVTLKNCTTGESTVAQNISDVFFTVSGATTGTVGNATASYINISDTGVITTATAGGQWGLCSSGGTFHLDDLGCGATGTPADTIVGTAACSPAASICGNDPHNPLLNGTGTWTITAAGVSAASTISGVTISFGTQDFSSPSVPTPEPATIMLMGLGIAGLFLLRRKQLLA